MTKLMKRFWNLITDANRLAVRNSILAVAVIGAMAVSASAKPEPRHIMRESLEDKIRGG